MPLLCTSLLALLLLHLSLSCDKTENSQLREHYMAVVQTDLSNTERSLKALLQNSSCPEVMPKLPSCIADNTEIGKTLHNLTCKMVNLRISNTSELARSVLHSVRCSCREKPTKEPNVGRKRTRTAVHQRTDKPQQRRKTKRLCKAMEILSCMTECYEMLNTISPDT